MVDKRLINIDTENKFRDVLPLLSNDWTQLNLVNNCNGPSSTTMSINDSPNILNNQSIVESYLKPLK